MKTSSTRFAILGCGIIADVHAKGIQNTKEAELAGVCDCVPAKARRMAETYGTRAYEHMHEMLPIRRH